MLRSIYLLLTLLLIYSCNSDSKKVMKIVDASTPITTLLDSLGLEKEKLHILIDKSDYLLYVKFNNVTLKKYPVVFGTDPINDKLMEGDRRTPEGIFKIRDFYPHKDWSKFIWINYPTKNSWNKHNQAKAINEISQEATIGSEIGIHGTPLGREDLISSRSNWTWGCISMTNEDIDDLYQAIYSDMIIKITK